MSYQEVQEQMRRDDEAARVLAETQRLETDGAPARDEVLRASLAEAQRALVDGAQPRRTLYEIGASAAVLDALLERLEGDVSDSELADLIDEWLRLDALALESKLDDYAALIREYSQRADMRRQEAKRLRGLIDADENRAGRMKERLLHFFEEHGIEKVETKRFRVSVASNGGAIPLLLDEGVDPRALAPQFQRVEIELDEGAIREALADGMSLAFARFGERGRHVRIR